MSRPSQRSHRQPRSQSGFTLIELFIALAVFSIGVLTLAVIIPTGTRKSDNSGQQSRASEFSAARAEELLDATYTDDDLTPGTHTDDAGNPYLGQYYVEWVVEDGAPISGCKRVTIKVHRSSLTDPTLAQIVILKVQADS